MKRTSKIYFKCDKCGFEREYTPNSFDEEGCWNISLGRAGYGSTLDGCEVDFDLCDKCLRELVDSFTIEGQERVLNSGSNQYGSSEDWIKAKELGCCIDDLYEVVDDLYE
jgi:hypothetical protein